MPRRPLNRENRYEAWENGSRGRRGHGTTGFLNFQKQVPSVNPWINLGIHQSSTSRALPFRHHRLYQTAQIGPPSDPPPSSSRATGHSTASRLDPGVHLAPSWQACFNVEMHQRKPSGPASERREGGSEGSTPFLSVTDSKQGSRTLYDIIC